jgi:hypothetical protein
MASVDARETTAAPGDRGKYEQFVYHRGGSIKPSVVTATWEGYKKAGPPLISTDHHGTADGQRLQVSSFLTHQLS